MFGEDVGAKLTAAETEFQTQARRLYEDRIAAGVSILIAPYAAEQRNAAIVQFPGGYVAEIHSPIRK